MDVVVGREFGKSLPAELRGYGDDGRARIIAGGDALQSGWHSRSRLAGLGITAQEIADLIKVSAGTTLPLIVSQNPGTLYETDAQGNIRIYHQPTGTTANLAVSSFGNTGGGNVGGGAGGQTGANIQTPYGSASLFGNISTGTVLMVGGMALLAVLLLKKG